MDPELVALADAASTSGRAPLPDISLTEARERIMAGNRMCAAGPAIRSVKDHDVRAAHGPLGVRVYEDAGDPAATLVYAHGGGWITGDLDYADELCRFLARDAGLRVVSVDYRLAPEHPHPAPLEDLRAAWDWTVENWRDAGPLGIAGDSAGGNLASVTAIETCGLVGRAPDFQVLLYPVTDSNFTNDSYTACAGAFPLGRADLEYCFEQYSDPLSWSDPRVAPLMTPDLTELPPSLVVTAGHDPLHDEGVALAQRLDEASVPTEVMDFPTLCHGFLRFTGASAACRHARSTIVDAVARLAYSAQLTE